MHVRMCTSLFVINKWILSSTCSSSSSLTESSWWMLVGVLLLSRGRASQPTNNPTHILQTSNAIIQEPLLNHWILCHWLAQHDGRFININRLQYNTYIHTEWYLFRYPEPSQAPAVLTHLNGEKIGNVPPVHRQPRTTRSIEFHLYPKVEECRQTLRHADCRQWTNGFRSPKRHSHTHTHYPNKVALWAAGSLLLCMDHSCVPLWHSTWFFSDSQNRRRTKVYYFFWSSWTLFVDSFFELGTISLLSI